MRPSSRSRCPSKRARSRAPSSRNCPSKSTADGGAASDPLAWFDDMAGHCLAYARGRRREGARIVGICCEYTPRELVMAAGAVPVCLCGGDADMIPAAETRLPANLCPLVKSTYGYAVNRANPFLEMADLLVAETTCDGKKKMYELLAEKKPMHVVELPQIPETAASFEHWLAELRRLVKALEKITGRRITNARMEKAIALMNAERGLRRRLAGLMKRDDPPVTGRRLLDAKALISCVPGALDSYRRAIDVLAARAPSGRAPPRPVRVLLTGVPMPHGAERVVDLLEKSGGLVVCQENCTGLKPILEDAAAGTGDPLAAIARKYIHLPCSVMTPNTGRFDSLARLAPEYRAECVVEVIWHACLTYDVESNHVRELAERKLRLPYLRIETDYSPSDTARIETRIQALYETVAARRGVARRRRAIK